MSEQTIPSIAVELWKPVISKEMIEACGARFGDALKAIVLTGSVARDEATFIQRDGHWELLGDADFFLVFPNASAVPDGATIRSVTGQVEAALRAHGLKASVGAGAVPRSYFEKLPRHIATYELRATGRVIWGNPDLLSAVPEFESAEISREDAWRMLANRIIELLEALASDERSSEARYRTIKLFLDMATSYLVFEGRYCPTYSGREAELRRIANEPSVQVSTTFPLRPFVSRVSECTRFKLDGRTMVSAPEKLLEDVIQCARVLWRWELQQLTGDVRELSDSELMSRWMARQPASARLRGWASVLRRSGWARSWREWPRWLRLAWRGSPRYWVYRVGSEAFISQPGQQDTFGIDWGSRAVRLPLALSFATSGSRWTDLAQSTVVNYRRFLEGTLA